VQLHRCDDLLQSRPASPVAELNGFTTTPFAIRFNKICGKDELLATPVEILTSNGDLFERTTSCLCLQGERTDI